MIQCCDTGPREAIIKVVKQDDAHTNRKPIGRTEQLADKHNVMHALRAADKLYNKSDVKEVCGLVRRIMCAVVQHNTCALSFLPGVPSGTGMAPR